MLYISEKVWRSRLRRKVFQMINVLSVLTPTFSSSCRKNVSSATWSNTVSTPCPLVSPNHKMNWGYSKMIEGDQVSKDCLFQHFSWYHLSNRASQEQGSLQAWIWIRINKASCQWPSCPQQDYISTSPLFSKIRSSIDLALATLLCDLWPGRCLTASGYLGRFQAKNTMKNCRRNFPHLQITPPKISSLSLNPPLLCLRPALDKSWEN